MNNKNLGDSKFWKVVNLAGNAIGLNLMFIISCLPVVTIGPALCGLYSGVRYMIRGDGWFRGFRAGFTTNFIRTAIAGVLSTAFIAYVMLQFNGALNFSLEEGNIVPAITYGIMVMIPAMLTAPLWPLNIYIPYQTADWLKTSVSLCFKVPLYTLVSAAMFLLPVVLALYFTMLAFEVLLVIIAVYFALTAFVTTLLYKDSLIALLMRYRQEHPEEE